MATKKTIEVLSLELIEIPITIVGTTPLITHCWSEKAKRQIRDTQTGTPKNKKHDIRIPYNDFIASMNWLSLMPAFGETNEEAEKNYKAAVKKGAHWGFHIGGIKQSMITGAARSGMDVKMTELRGSFYLKGVGDYATDEYAEIITPNPPKMREDMVMVGGMSRSADLRYRAQFDEWEIRLVMVMNKNGKYSEAQLINLVNAGGFAVGIGEWRPEKDGQHGMYRLKLDK